MRVTLTRDLPPHKKGTTHQVSPTTGARLIAKGAAEKATAKAKADDGDQGDGKSSGGTP
jgi:hypothetical protein